MGAMLYERTDKFLCSVGENTKCTNISFVDVGRWWLVGRKMYHPRKC